MRRVLTISDLHLGGENHPMLGHRELLSEFFEQLAAHPDKDHLELVIAGDFVDFLAEAPLAAWTPSEGQAVQKLEAVFGRLPRLFDALARCASCLPRLTLLLGNHDVELAYPRVR